MAKKLFVGGLPWAVESSDLESLFAPYGAVLSAFVVKDRETGRSKGFGFVELESDEDADRAKTELDGSEVRGRSIRVNEAHERGDRPNRGHDRY